MMNAYRKKRGMGRSPQSGGIQAAGQRQPPQAPAGKGQPQQQGRSGSGPIRQPNQTPDASGPMRNAGVGAEGNQVRPGASMQPQQPGVPGVPGQQKPDPRELQKIFDISRTQGPQAVQSYVAQNHGPEAAQALAAHPAVQQANAQAAQQRPATPGSGGVTDGHTSGGYPAGGTPPPQGGMPSLPGASQGAAGAQFLASMGSGQGAPGAGANVAAPVPGNPPAALAPRYQQMIANGMDPAVAQQRAAQFQAGQLPGQGGSQAPPSVGAQLPPGGSPPPQLHTMPGVMPNPGASPNDSGFQNAGAGQPGLQSQPPQQVGAFPKPYPVPGQQPGQPDMRDLLRQRLGGGQMFQQ